MPMPSPHSGEDKAHFISRFMSDERMKREFPSVDQRLAVAEKKWSELEKQEPLDLELLAQHLVEDAIGKILDADQKEQIRNALRGIPGTNGQDGAPGADGANGQDGAPGADGKPGADGAPGPKGDQGAPGPQGPIGPQGERGPVGFPGRDGKDGRDGVDGQNGTDGRDGVDGKDGARGPMGPRGEKGDKGEQGEPGREGPPGRDGGGGGFGGRGTVGPRGPAGPTGATGPAGPTGDTGPAGPQGDTGPAGPQGDTGPAGADGADGADGAPGAPGADGATGPAGPAGADGTNGTNGYSVLSSPNNPPSSGLGVNGDWAIYDSGGTVIIFGPKAAGAWPAGQSLVGPTGATGATGSTGAAGADGQGVPTGGTAGQILKKVSSTDFDTTWAPVPNVLNFVSTTSDVTNNNTTPNTMQDVTGLSFPVVAGHIYYFRFFITYQSNASTTGSRWSINGPSFSGLRYQSRYTLSTTTETLNADVHNYDDPAACNATSGDAIAVCMIEGHINASANGTVIARFACEVAGPTGSITAKKGSCLQWCEVGV